MDEDKLQQHMYSYMYFPLVVYPVAYVSRHARLDGNTRFYCKANDLIPSLFPLFVAAACALWYVFLVTIKGPYLRHHGRKDSIRRIIFNVIGCVVLPALMWCFVIAGIPNSKDKIICDEIALQIGIIATTSCCGSSAMLICLAFYGDPYVIRYAWGGYDSKLIDNGKKREVIDAHYHDDEDTIDNEWVPVAMVVTDDM